jgi:cell division protein FtsL
MGKETGNQGPAASQAKQKNKKTEVPAKYHQSFGKRCHVLAFTLTWVQETICIYIIYEKK